MLKVRWTKFNIDAFNLSQSPYILRGVPSGSLAIPGAGRK